MTPAEIKILSLVESTSYFVSKSLRLEDLRILWELGTYPFATFSDLKRSSTTRAYNAEYPYLPAGFLPRPP